MQFSELQNDGPIPAIVKPMMVRGIGETKCTPPSDLVPAQGAGVEPAVWYHGEM